MDLSAVSITTERLKLVPITIDYAGDIFGEFTGEVTQYMYPRPSEEIEETKQFIHGSVTHLKDGTHLMMVILDKDTGDFLGCAALHSLGSPRPEFGIWLKKSAHGNGYGFEAVEALKRWADENVGCSSFYYPVDERNIPSRRIPERLGGRIVSRSTEISMSGKTLRIIGYEIPGKGVNI